MSRWDAFVDRVHRLVRAVPRGRVVTYGQLARLAGRPRAAREVGWIAHAGGDHLPWQRVVDRVGGLASGFRGGRVAHRRALRHEGVHVGPGHRVDLRVYRWWPDPSTASRLGLPLEAIARAQPQTAAARRSSLDRSESRKL